MSHFNCVSMCLDVVSLCLTSTVGWSVGRSRSVQHLQFAGQGGEMRARSAVSRLMMVAESGRAGTQRMPVLLGAVGDRGVCAS